MITAKEWEAYNDAVSKISDGAAASVENAVLGWCRSNPNATVAESRETAKLIMEGCMQSYDGLASAFAARWYDHQAESNGVNLQNAVTAAVYTPKKTDAVARYQVRKLTREGPSAFAKACGEYARNDALRALNETIIANVGRDRKKGVRFARVPTGRETCTFCIMLASRGAVYHTRKTAGEFKHFHRHCDCKVVPGFEDDPMAELVEGYDPKEARKLWLKASEIDAIGGISASLKQSTKELMSANRSLSVEDALAVAKQLSGRIPPTSDDITEWASGKKRSEHMKKHASVFGLDYTTEEGRTGYEELFSATMDAWDAIVYYDDFGGQRPDECVFYFKGDTVAIVNTATSKRISLFKHERGISECIDYIWDKAHGRS